MHPASAPLPGTHQPSGTEPTDDDHLLTIQNAADLQWPAEGAANAGVRDEFRLTTFPPRGGAAAQEPPAPPPQPPPPPAK